MAISLKTQKMLWGRAAARCSMPECRLDLYEDETETDDPTLIGEACHMVAESDNGPRCDPSMTIDQRNSYSNLVLLCRNHHKVIDAQEAKYTVDVLREIKSNHENWVTQNLEYDSAKQFDDEQYADIVDNWEKKTHIDNWSGWSSFIFSASLPRLDIEVDKDLKELCEYLFNRVWSGRYIDVERAFANFHRVLSDFLNVFHKHSEISEFHDMHFTNRFYKIDHYDHELYHKLLFHYEHHVDLVQDLMLELTRSGNLVCDKIRQNLTRIFRLKEGRLTVECGPLEPDFYYRSVVTQYSNDERSKPSPYPGLEQFLCDRQFRDIHFGEGKLLGEEKI